MERLGCCDKMGLGCYACCDCCLQEAHFHEGLAEGDVGAMDRSRVFGSAKVPVCGGCLTPTVEMHVLSLDPYA